MLFNVIQKASCHFLLSYFLTVSAASAQNC